MNNFTTKITTRELFLQNRNFFNTVEEILTKVDKEILIKNLDKSIELTNDELSATFLLTHFFRSNYFHIYDEILRSSTRMQKEVYIVKKQTDYKKDFFEYFKNNYLTFKSRLFFIHYIANDYYLVLNYQ